MAERVERVLRVLARGRDGSQYERARVRRSEEGAEQLREGLPTTCGCVETLTHGYCAHPVFEGHEGGVDHSGLLRSDSRVLVRVDALLRAGQIDQRERAQTGSLVCVPAPANMHGTHCVRSRGRVVHARRRRRTQRLRVPDECEQCLGRLDGHLELRHHLHLPRAVCHQPRVLPPVEHIPRARAGELGIGNGHLVRCVDELEELGGGKLDESAHGKRLAAARLPVHKHAGGSRIVHGRAHKRRHRVGVHSSRVGALVEDAVEDERVVLEEKGSAILLNPAVVHTDRRA
mmetsp:Transcript_23401/g.58390  ORF Transcript_23401/g.58390 Transcript_23401/m.58390 type:complete len:288 (-) Transcript_23401:476-1339(-)